MIIKALILSTFITSEPAIVSTPPIDRIEARRRGGKGNKKRRRGGNGLR